MLRSIDVATAHSLDGATVGFNVNDVPHGHALLLEGLVDGGVQAQLLDALGALEAQRHLGDGLAVAPEGILRLLGDNLSHLALVHVPTKGGR